jgi:purine nucleoside phosphorylase
MQKNGLNTVQASEAAGRHRIATELRRAHNKISIKVESTTAQIQELTSMQVPKLVSHSSLCAGELKPEFTVEVLRISTSHLNFTISEMCQRIRIW